ncbi:hypothetical protein [Siphonobacter sp. SORGH_AS_0500]|nr:hypothetical protein [Siphonobacter sp. SORGH_AS_0500]MDQ1087640.1 hypothetical protein [Siphonobacter sp. SORGH_AS_1065]MDR6193789.1 hypothetical protein [Siphonobacter sp. SORGH_AS_0500]
MNYIQLHLREIIIIGSSGMISLSLVIIGLVWFLHRKLVEQHWELNQFKE